MQRPFAESLESSVDDEEDNGGQPSYGGLAGAPVISETPLGSRRTVASISAKEWAFLAITGAGIVASSGFAIYFIATNADTLNADFTLALLLLLNGCFTAYYLIDGVFTERAYELLALVGTVMLVTVYLLANFLYTRGWVDSVKIARLVIASLLGPVCVALGGATIYEYLSSGNFIFRKVGADASLQRLCRRLFATESVIKFDLQSTLSVVLLVVKSGTLSLLEKLSLGLGIGFSLVWSALAIAALRLENYTLTVVLLVAGLAQPAYMTFIVVENVYDLRNSTEPLIPDNADFSNSLPTVSLATSVFALLLRFTLLALMAGVIRNFGQGLRRKLVPPILRRLTRSQYESV